MNEAFICIVQMLDHAVYFCWTLLDIVGHVIFVCWTVGQQNPTCWTGFFGVSNKIKNQKGL